MKKLLKERNSKRNHKLFSKLLEKQGTPIKELGVPEMTAWQAMEDDYIEESDYLPGGAEQKVDRFMKPMASLTKTVDTKEEAAGLIKTVLANVKELVGDKLTPQEIAASLKLVLQDMAMDAKKVASDVAGDIAKVADQNEAAHVVIAPDTDEKTDELSEEEENNPWAICTASVGREDETKYEDCVKAVKKQNKK
tara:strand:- start:705 stop:1286 length:582 start_codon:yes stop_codon:yes gene_type:complete